MHWGMFSCLMPKSPLVYQVQKTAHWNQQFILQESAEELGPWHRINHLESATLEYKRSDHTSRTHTLIFDIMGLIQLCSSRPEHAVCLCIHMWRLCSICLLLTMQTANAGNDEAASSSELPPWLKSHSNQGHSSERVQYSKGCGSGVQQLGNGQRSQDLPKARGR